MARAHPPLATAQAWRHASCTDTINSGTGAIPLHPMHAHTLAKGRRGSTTTTSAANQPQRRSRLGLSCACNNITTAMRSANHLPPRLACAWDTLCRHVHMTESQHSQLSQAW